MLNCIFLLHHSWFTARHAQALLSNNSTSEQRAHVVYSSWFAYRQKSHSTLLHFDTEGRKFFRSVAAIMSLTKVLKKCRRKSYRYGTDCTERDIFKKEKL